MHDINAAIGAEASPVRSSSIPCHLRAELPLLEFELGEEGEKFSVSAFDYTMEVDYAKMGYPSIGTRCASLILPVEDIGLPSDGEMIMLGSAFLKGRYSVWDWGRMEVGCEFYLLSPLVRILVLVPFCKYQSIIHFALLRSGCSEWCDGVMILTGF